MASLDIRPYVVHFELVRRGQPDERRPVHVNAYSAIEAAGQAALELDAELGGVIARGSATARLVKVEPDALEAARLATAEAKDTLAQVLGLVARPARKGREES